MKHFIAYILRISIPFMTLICSVNYFVSTDYIYKCDIMDDIISQARKGYNATEVNANMDERLFKKKYAELYNCDSVSYLILGSSRMMTASYDALKGQNALNLAISGATIEDIIAIYQASIDNRIYAENVVIGIDPLYFNPTYGGQWWKSIAEYYYKFMGLEYEGGYERLTNRLFSINYFRIATSAIYERIGEEYQIIFTKDYINEGYTRRVDGSVYYPKVYREKPVKDIEKEATDFNIVEYSFDTLSIERLKLFDRLVDSIRAHGAQVQIVQFPYHPIIYKRIAKYGCMDQVRRYIRYLCCQKGAIAYGDYNPKNDDFTNIDFYDATHAKKESLDRILKKLQ